MLLHISRRAIVPLSPLHIGNKVAAKHMVIHESGKNISEGVVSAAPEYGAYEWGRSQKKPKYWESKRALLWDCPDCSHCNVKWTQQKTSNRYYPLRGQCKGCNSKFRNILPHKKQWIDRRKAAQETADLINQAKGLR